jgi:hypothetical protein
MGPDSFERDCMATPLYTGNPIHWPNGVYVAIPGRQYMLYKTATLIKALKLPSMEFYVDMDFVAQTRDFQSQWELIGANENGE